MIISRDYYLNELTMRKNNSLVKVITGIRRRGKSFLLNKLFYDWISNFVGRNISHDRDI